MRSPDDRLIVDLVSRRVRGHGRQPRGRPGRPLRRAQRDPRRADRYVRGRAGYDYAHHGRARNPDIEFLPDDIVDRFCLLGPVEDHVAKLRGFESLGVTQVNIYLMHGEMDATLGAYGRDIIPTLHPLAAS